MQIRRLVPRTALAAVFVGGVLALTSAPAWAATAPPPKPKLPPVTAAACTQGGGKVVPHIGKKTHKQTNRCAGGTQDKHHVHG